MSGSPAPRPALKKAADAHIHPAAPGLRPAKLRHAGDGPPAPLPEGAEPSAPDPGPKGKGGRAPEVTTLGTRSRPLGGATSDSLRGPRKDRSGSNASKSSGKKVELTVKIPKSLRKDFQAALKADRRNADDVVAALLRGWLEG